MQRGTTGGLAFIRGIALAKPAGTFELAYTSLARGIDDEKRELASVGGQLVLRGNESPCSPPFEGKGGQRTRRKKCENGQDEITCTPDLKTPEKESIGILSPFAKGDSRRAKIGDNEHLEVTEQATLKITEKRINQDLVPLCKGGPQGDWPLSEGLLWRSQPAGTFELAYTSLARGIDDEKRELASGGGQLVLRGNESPCVAPFEKKGGQQTCKKRR